MSYKALYRKYRPSVFEDVKGQTHVVKTLTNALEKEKFSHAYLFTGPRGTGKTSLAKIVAKTLNCEKYPTGTPCGVCESCKSIDQNSNPNVIELDAASNNGVDDIREIRDNVKFVPINNRFKVYIIDEVHMLSSGAFNALLKTLEEPPSHAIFILCTTEVHKIPATIISRVQQFDLRAISTEDISKNIKEIVKNENLKISKEAVNKIAKEANGGMRDALSLLDQVIAYAKEEITVYDVNVVSGSVFEEDFYKLTLLLNENNVTMALELVDKILSDGKEVLKIFNGYISFLKDILLYKNGIKQAEYLEKIEGFNESQNEIDEQLLFYYIDVFSKSLYDAKYSSNPKTQLDLAIIKSVNVELQGESAFSARLKKIEERLKDLNQMSISEVLIEEKQDKEEISEESFTLDNDIFSEFEELFEKPKRKNKTDDVEHQKDAELDEVENVVDDVNEQEIEILEKNIDTEEQKVNETEKEESFETLFFEKDEQENSINLFDEEFITNTKIEINPFSYDAKTDEEKIKILTEQKTTLTVFEENEEKIVETVDKLDEKEETEKPIPIVTANDIAEVLTYAVDNKENSTHVKNYIISKWSQILLGAEVAIHNIADLFSNCKLEATSSSTMILTHENVDIVNQLMRKDNQDRLKALLRNVYNNDFSYIVLPQELWKIKRKEFVDQLTTGIMKPQLSELSFPGFKTTQQNTEIKPSIVKDAIDFVGEDKVIIE